jgi:hypothetical protein
MTPPHPRKNSRTIAWGQSRITTRFQIAGIKIPAQSLVRTGLERFHLENYRTVVIQGLKCHVLEALFQLHFLDEIISLREYVIEFAAKPPSRIFFIHGRA